MPGSFVYADTGRRAEPCAVSCCAVLCYGVLCREEMKDLFSGYVAVPTGVAIFPRELYNPPCAWARSLYNIVHWEEQPKVRRHGSFQGLKGLRDPGFGV
jgi:hypothetical protein